MTKTRRCGGVIKLKGEINMGYRLEVTQVGGTLSYYGTKLYGYVEDETALKSYKFLRDNGYFDADDVVFTYGA